MLLMGLGSLGDRKRSRPKCPKQLGSEEIVCIMNALTDAQK